MKFGVIVPVIAAHREVNRADGGPKLYDLCHVDASFWEWFGCGCIILLLLVALVVPLVAIVSCIRDMRDMRDE